MKSPTRLEYIFMIAIVVCPSVLIMGWFLISEASEGNMIAIAILITCGVLLVGLFANLSTLIAIFANQKQDNQVIENARQTQADTIAISQAAQRDALTAAQTLLQLQKAETEHQRNQPQITVIEPEPRYLESGNDIIEGMVD